MAHHWVASRWGGPEEWRLQEYEVPAPSAGEVTIRVSAAGVNPADLKHVAHPRPGVHLPIPIGYEVSDEITAVGPATTIGSGAVRVGDEVLASLELVAEHDRIVSVAAGDRDRSIRRFDAGERPIPRPRPR